MIVAGSGPTPEEAGGVTAPTPERGAEVIGDKGLAMLRGWVAENSHPIESLAWLPALIARLDEAESKRTYWHTRYIKDHDKWAVARDTAESRLSAANAVVLAAEVFAEKHARFHPDFWVAARPDKFCDACDFGAAVRALDSHSEATDHPPTSEGEPNE